MQEFNYTVIDKSGKKKRGFIEAFSKENAIDSLQNKGMYILEISSAATNIYKGKKVNVKLKDVAIFSRQVATMLSSGVNVVTAIEAMEGQSDDKGFKSVLKDVKKKVEQGESLSESMKEHPKAFPSLLCTMIEAGEMTGDTDNTFERMADYYDKENKMKQKIVNATIYPSILVIVSLLAITALMIFAVPKFMSIFEEMQVPLPLLTKIVLGLGDWMKSYWYIFMIIILLIILGYKAYYSSKEGGILIDKLKLKIPVIGEILTFAAISRFSRTLSSLLEAGVGMIPSLEITKKVVLNKYIMNELDTVVENMKTGERLSDNLKTIKIMPKIFPVMIKTGEESGKIDYMLLKVAELYENEVDMRVSRINTIIEPVIIVVLAVVLGSIMAAVMLPMFTLYGSI